MLEQSLLLAAIKKRVVYVPGSVRSEHKLQVISEPLIGARRAHPGVMGTNLQSTANRINRTSDRLGHGELHDAESQRAAGAGPKLNQVNLQRCCVLLNEFSVKGWYKFG